LATTLASIRKQIADLEKKAEALIKEEAQGAIAKVRELIDRYGLSPEDLGFGGGAKAAKAGKPGRRVAAKPGRKKKAPAKAAGVPMYRDPKTGKTWTGRGKPPAWIAGAKSREAFLIGAESAAPAAAEAPAKPARRAGRKAVAEAAAPVKARRGAKPAEKPAPRKAAKKAAKPARGKRATKTEATPADQAAPAVAGDTPASSS
jgi:DNA-binding protein H-NS